MTILLTRCPKCGENFMMADTEELEGTCILCSCIKPFTKEEMSDAETRRDKLSEEYIPRMQEAYEKKDTATMSALAEEAASKGVTSWYAWFFIGWCHMYEGHISRAFDDFELAVSFLDEESFDEFYDLVADTCIESLASSHEKEDGWSGDCMSLFGFSDTLTDRFGELMECGFEEDLITRMGYMDAEVSEEPSCCFLAYETLNIAVRYSHYNLYMPDHLPILSAASWTVEAMGRRAQEIGASKNTMAMFPLMKEFLDRLLKIESDIYGDFGEEKLDALCDLWASMEKDEHEEHLTRAYSSFASYMVSAGRNKGQKKKMDAALLDYDRSIRKSLEGLPLDEEQDEEGSDEYDFDDVECPLCGKRVPAGPGGIVECECGFRHRNVTRRILDLPEDEDALVAMAEEAFDGGDAELLNNLGNRILDQGDHPMGYLAIARSLILDGMLAESLDALCRKSTKLSGKDGRMFYDRALDMVVEGIANASKNEDLLSSIFLIPLVSSLERLEGRSFLLDLMDRILGLGSAKTLVSDMIVPLSLFRLMAINMGMNTSLESWKSLCDRCARFLETALARIDGVPEDEDSGQCSENIRKSMDVIGYMQKRIEQSISRADPASLEGLEKRWRCGDVHDILSDLMLKTIWHDTKYDPGSDEVRDARDAVDAALLAYMEGPSK